MKHIIRFGAVLVAALCISGDSQAQQYRGGYSYPGRGYYSAGRYSERTPQYSQRSYGGGYRNSYTPRGGYDWSYGGGNRGYLGGRGGGWGGEW